MNRDIAMVFPNYALYPHMTVAANIGFALKIHKTPKAEVRRRVEDAARLMGIEDLLDQKPGQLSGGQRQRVAMGRALVREPVAFLMDEPLSNLDARLRVQMRAEISRLQRRLGVATLYVTHDQTEAMTMGDRVAVLRAGTVCQFDTPQRLYEHPADAFVASFIGSPSMNLYRVDLGHDARSIRLGRQSVELPETVFALRPGLARYGGRSVVVGLRPEFLRLDGPPRSRASTPRSTSSSTWATRCWCTSPSTEPSSPPAWSRRATRCRSTPWARAWRRSTPR